jgi:hypothetical protein
MTDPERLGIATHVEDSLEIGLLERGNVDRLRLDAVSAPASLRG